MNCLLEIVCLPPQCGQYIWASDEVDILPSNTCWIVFIAAMQYFKSTPHTIYLLC